MSRLFLKKSIARIQSEAAKSELKRSLGAINLTSLGVGAIIGAGIFVRYGPYALNGYLDNIAFKFSTNLGF